MTRIFSNIYTDSTHTTHNALTLISILQCFLWAEKQKIVIHLPFQIVYYFDAKTRFDNSIWEEKRADNNVIEWTDSLYAV